MPGLIMSLFRSLLCWPHHWRGRSQCIEAAGLSLPTAFSVFVAAVGAVIGPAKAQDSDYVPWTEATFAKIKPIAEARYRFEFVDQDGLERDAKASTLRTRFGIRGDDFGDFSFLVEAENILHIGADRFNDGRNGRDAFPRVNDPEALEINQLYATYKGLPDTNIRVGRQVIILNDGRFVANDPWRQNETSYDAIRIENRSILNTKLTYAYIDRVHAALGDPDGELESNSHVFGADFELERFGEIKTYAILLDFNDADALSSASYGARWENSVTVTDYFVTDLFAEYAFQADYGDNPADYGLSYLHIGAGTAYGPISGRIAYERLGGDGVDAIQFPIGQRHRRNGLADAFATTPASGLGDLYVELEAGWPRPPIGGRRITALAAYHRFSAAEGANRLGDEFDAILRWAHTRRITSELRMAFFDGTAAGPAGRNKVMASIQYRY
ncbi:MAG: hypothetical protein Tsb0010_17630 [Parvularculaceae bacterium]